MVNRLETMTNTVMLGDLNSYSDGMRAASWAVPVDGFEWKDDPGDLGKRLLKEGDRRFPKGPWLIPRGARTRRYAVLKKPGLLDRFEQIGLAPGKARILAFANQYGFL